MKKVHQNEKKISTENLNEKTLISSKILPVREYQLADYMINIESDTTLKENSVSKKCLQMENLSNTSSASNFHFQDKKIHEKEKIEIIDESKILEKRNYFDLKETTSNETYNKR